MFETLTTGIQLDVCKVCQFVWFDAQEFERMPVAKPLLAEHSKLRSPASEAVALYEVKRMAEEAEESGPSETWQHVPAIFGLPVECDSPRLTGYPAVTWTGALVVLVVSIAAFMFGHSVVEDFGLIPSQAWRYGGMTLITSFFLHGGILHLVSNLYFLLIFGDNVEDYLGRWRFGLLLLVATIAGDFAHIAGDPRATMPCVGASGGISGIITFYALQFPHARLGLYLIAFYRLHWLQFPAWAGLALWVLLQFIGTAQQLAGFTNVSALAHLGGAATGLFAWVFWRVKERGK